MATLAWFSSITHLTTLTVLRTYLKVRPFWRAVRVFSMVIFIGILAYALGVTGLPNWPVQPYSNLYWNPGIPAKCYLHEMGHEHGSLTITIPVTFVAVNLTTRVTRLFDVTSDPARRIFRESPSCLIKNVIKALEGFSVPPETELRLISGHAWMVGFRFLLYSSFLSLYALGKASYEAADSVLWEVCSSLGVQQIFY